MSPFLLQCNALWKTSRNEFWLIKNENIHWNHIRYVTYPLFSSKNNFYDFLIFVRKNFASNNFVLKLKQRLCYKVHMFDSWMFHFWIWTRLLQSKRTNQNCNYMYFKSTMIVRDAESVITMYYIRYNYLHTLYVPVKLLHTINNLYNIWYICHDAVLHGCKLIWTSCKVTTGYTHLFN